MNLAHARARRRRGASLIEVVLIVGSVSIILGLCGAFLHLLLKLDRTGRGSIADTTSVARLARQFRHDVHAAATAKVVPSGGDATGGLELSAPGRPLVAYRAEGDRLVRTESEGAVVRRREAYPLTQLGAAHFHADGPWAELTLPRRGDAAGPSPRPGFRVEASLGKDKMIASRGEASK
jgi:hypothetical protein